MIQAVILIRTHIVSLPGQSDPATRLPWNAAALAGGVVHDAAQAANTISPTLRRLLREALGE